MGGGGETPSKAKRAGDGWAYDGRTDSQTLGCLAVEPGRNENENRDRRPRLRVFKS